MKLSAWYPLDAAAERAPARAGLLQVRLASGLVSYPRGKSAMVHYEYALDLRARAAELATDLKRADLLCRHDEELTPAEAADLDGTMAALLAQFERRFGSQPVLPDEAD